MEIPKPKRQKKKPKRIPLISKRKKERIKQFGSEKDLFMKIWKVRPHMCDICRAWIPEPKTYCFAHTKSKAVYPELRYEESNISIVCSVICHLEIDKLRNINK